MKERDQEWIDWWTSLPIEERRLRREHARIRQRVGVMLALIRIRAELVEKLTATIADLEGCK